MNRNEDGFTIVELLVVMIVSSLLIGVITSFGLNYWGRTVGLSSAQQAFVSRLNAGDYLRNGVDSASGLITQNDLPDAHVGSADPMDVTGTHWLTIHAVPATITMGATGVMTPLIYYTRPSVDTSKNIVLNGSVAYEDDIVLYLDGTTKQLLARTIINPNVSSNAARSTCPAAVATTACPADIVIASDVSSMGMRYFSRSGNLINYQSSTDVLTGSFNGPDYPSVEIVEFTLNLYRKGELHSTPGTSNQTVIRVALRN